MLPLCIDSSPPSPPPANFEEPSMYVLNNFGKPCNIFRLSFITVAVVVLIFVFHIFLFSIYSEITCNLYYFCCSKMFFFIIAQFFWRKVTYFLSDAEGTSWGLLSRGGIAVLPLLGKQCAKRKDSQVSGK